MSFVLLHPLTLKGDICLTVVSASMSSCVCLSASILFRSTVYVVMYGVNLTRGMSISSDGPAHFVWPASLHMRRLHLHPRDKWDDPEIHARTVLYQCPLVAAVNLSLGRHAEDLCIGRGSQSGESMHMLGNKSGRSS